MALRWAIACRPVLAPGGWQISAVAGCDVRSVTVRPILADEVGRFSALAGCSSLARASADRAGAALRRGPGRRVGRAGRVRVRRAVVRSPGRFLGWSREAHAAGRHSLAQSRTGSVDADQAVVDVHPVGPDAQGDEGLLLGGQVLAICRAAGVSSAVSPCLIETLIDWSARRCLGHWRVSHDETCRRSRLGYTSCCFTISALTAATSGTCATGR